MTYDQAEQLIALGEMVRDMFQEQAPWIVAGAVLIGVVAGLQTWWIVLRGKDARKVW